MAPPAQPGLSGGGESERVRRRKVIEMAKVELRGDGSGNGSCDGGGGLSGDGLRKKMVKVVVSIMDIDGGFGDCWRW